MRMSFSTWLSILSPTEARPRSIPASRKIYLKLSVSTPAISAPRARETFSRLYRPTANLLRSSSLLLSSDRIASWSKASLSLYSPSYIKISNSDKTVIFFYPLILLYTVN